MDSNIGLQLYRIGNHDAFYIPNFLAVCILASVSSPYNTHLELMHYDYRKMRSNTSCVRLEIF